MNHPSVSVFAIGHSNHTIGRFLELLRVHGVTAIADIRSSPHSTSNPNFDREFLQHQLQQQAITYVYLGRELGARPEDPACDEHGRVHYRKLAKSPTFVAGLQRVLQNAKSSRLALLCAEKEPLACHRAILVAKELFALGATVDHIHDDGSLETHGAAMDRVLEILGMTESDLYRSKAEMIDDACAIQQRRVARISEEYREAVLK